MSVGGFFREFINTIPGLYVGEHVMTKEPPTLWQGGPNFWMTPKCQLGCSYAPGVNEGGRVLRYVRRWCKFHLDANAAYLGKDPGE